MWALGKAKEAVLTKVAGSLRSHLEKVTGQQFENFVREVPYLLFCCGYPHIIEWPGDLFHTSLF